MQTITLNKGVTMKVTITLGYVQVETPAQDCDGMRRTIDFPRVGKHLYGNPRFHGSVGRYVQAARIAARKALAAMPANTPSL